MSLLTSSLTRRLFIYLRIDYTQSQKEKRWHFIRPHRTGNHESVPVEDIRVGYDRDTPEGLEVWKGLTGIEPEVLSSSVHGTTGHVFVKEKMRGVIWEDGRRVGDWMWDGY